MEGASAQVGRRLVVTNRVAAGLVADGAGESAQRLGTPNEPGTVRSHPVDVLLNCVAESCHASHSGSKSATCRNAA